MFLRWCSSGIPEVTILLLSSVGILESDFDIMIDSKVRHVIVHWMLWWWWSSWLESELVILAEFDVLD